MDNEIKSFEDAVLSLDEIALAIHNLQDSFESGTEKPEEVDIEEAKSYISDIENEITQIKQFLNDKE